MRPLRPAGFLIALFLVLPLAATSAPASAQIPDVVKDAAEDAAEDQLRAEVRKLVQNAVHCAFDDLQCIRESKESGEEVVLTDEDGEVIYDDEGRPVQSQEELPPEKREKLRDPGEADANYDFQPGARELFADDFTSDNVGDFPRNLAFRGGSMEIVRWEGGRALRVNSGGGFDVELPERLPERFTLEFEYYTPDFVNDIRVYPVDAEGKAAGSHFIQVDPASSGVGIRAFSRDGYSSTKNVRGALTSELTPIRVMADAGYVKVFAGTRRVANIPSADLGRTSAIHFEMHDIRGQPAYIADIRVAAGGKDLYGTLEDEGRVAVDDILFATDRAEIRPESAEILETIGSMLEEHPELQLLIEGHTDSQGGYQHNMQLSKQRADAVKSYLVDELGIEADRLQTMGLGQTRPVASNDTEEGRKQNRRVELVKIGG